MNKKWGPYSRPYSHWDDHPEHPHKDWVMEVVNNDTRLGYVDWVNHQIEMLEFDKNDNQQ